MKIGIDARFYGLAGPGRYVSNLINELEQIDKENDYVIFVTKEGSEKYHANNPRFKKWIVNVPWYSLQEQTQLLIEFIRANLDLLHVPHFNMPVFYPRKSMVTIHDLTMHEFNNTDATTLPEPLYEIKKFAYKFVINSAARKARKIVVPSNTVRDEVVQKIKGAKYEKVAVSYEGVDQKLLGMVPRDERVLRTRIEEMGVKRNYFLYVGSAYPHKNLNNLIVSYKEYLQRTGRQEQLIIAGKIDNFSQRTAAFSHGLQLDGKVIYAAKFSESKYVPDNDLAYLYKGALAYVFPSLKEGFSITPLEAQALGVPVMLSDIPTHREIFGDTVLYFDPKSNIDITEKLLVIATDADLREKLVEAGLENAQKYSWRKMAEDILNIYESLK